MEERWRVIDPVARLCVGRLVFSQSVSLTFSIDRTVHVMSQLCFVGEFCFKFPFCYTQEYRQIFRVIKNKPELLYKLIETKMRKPLQPMRYLDLLWEMFVM